MRASPARGVASVFDPMRLRIARQAAMLTKKDLAQRIDVTPAAVSQYESGTTQPSAKATASLALALGMPVDFFSADRPLGEAPATTAHFRSLRATTQQERDRALRPRPAYVGNGQGLGTSRQAPPARSTARSKRSCRRPSSSGRNCSSLDSELLRTRERPGAERSSAARIVGRYLYALARANRRVFRVLVCVSRAARRRAFCRAIPPRWRRDSTRHMNSDI